MVIRLFVWRQLDLGAFEAGINLPLFRITANVRIMMPTGWSGLFEGILDTGNPITVIPRRIWRSAAVEFFPLPSQSIFGLGATEASALQGRLGRLMLGVEDEEAVSAPIITMAYLLDDDRGPLLLGCEGILTRAILRTNLAAMEASLEF